MVLYRKLKPELFYEFFGSEDKLIQGEYTSTTGRSPDSRGDLGIQGCSGQVPQHVCLNEVYSAVG